LNKEVLIEAINETITEDNVFKLVDGYNLIVDAMDNFPARFMLNKVAVQKKIPFFHGAIRGFEGRATTIIPGQTPCLNCLYPRVPEPRVSPVIGVAPAIIGSIQATEVIKHIVGIGALLTNRLLIYDGMSMEFMEIRVKRHPDCKECCHLWEGEV
jgi:molybdopterin/thiamine biosynthesis adenylyltransferase